MLGGKKRVGWHMLCFLFVTKLLRRITGFSRGLIWRCWPWNDDGMMTPNILKFNDVDG